MLKIVLLSLILISSSNLLAWTVYDDGRYTISSEEIDEHTELIYLTESAKSQIFKQANLDFNQYNNLKKTWLEKYFQKSLKELSFYKLIERITYLEYERQGIYIAFRSATDANTKKIKNKLFQELKDQVFKRVYNSQNLNNNQKVSARLIFGASLKNSAHPHKYNSSDEQVYKSWYNDQLKKIDKRARLEVIKQAMSEFEAYLQATGHVAQIISPLEVANQYNLAKNKLNQLSTTGKSKKDIFNYLEQNPFLKAIVSDFYDQSPRLIEQQKLKEKFPAQFIAAKNKLQSQVSNKINRAMLQEVFSIVDISLEMLGDGLNDQELQDGKDEMMREFQKTNELHLILTARAYDLAISLRKNQQNIKPILNASLFPKLDELNQELIKAIKNEVIHSGSLLSYPIAEAAKEFVRSLISSNDFQEYEQKIISNYLWFIKLRIEDLYDAESGGFTFDLLSKSDALNAIEAQLRVQARNQVRKNGIANYVDQLYLKISPTPYQVIVGNNVFDYLFSD